jgi:hypothetical protein
LTIKKHLRLSGLYVTKNTGLIWFTLVVLFESSY